MNRSRSRAVALCTAWALALGQAHAALVLFSDRASWEAAVLAGPGLFAIQTETFNSILTDTEFTDSFLTFDGMVLRLEATEDPPAEEMLVDVPTGDPPYRYGLPAGGIDGTALVNLGGIWDTSRVTLEFAAPVWAVGFDTLNYDSTGDRAEAFVGADLIGLFPLQGETGFIGVIDTEGPGIFAVDIRGPASDSAFNAFDNVSTAVAVIPEPSSMMLLGLAALGLSRIRARRRTSAGDGP